VNTLRWISLLLLDLAMLVATPVLVLLALPFIREDYNNILPSWLQWLNTPDDRGADQGMYEPQVYAVYRHFGLAAKTWYWLGIRNQCNGLFSVLCPRYDGSPIVTSTWWKFKIYSTQGFSEITWPSKRVSFGYKVHTLKTAKAGDLIWWVCMPAFWKSREY
jgi:hypothetical protein